MLPLRCWTFAALVLAGWFPTAASAQSPLAGRLKPLIESHKGDIAVTVKHLKTGETFAHNGQEAMPTASLIKLPIMVEVYRQAEEGTIDLDERLTLDEDDKVQGSGILTTHFSAGATFTLRDAVRLMIAYSDNTATNLVLEKIGLPATNATMEKLGWKNTKIHSFVFRANSSILPDRSKQFGLGSTTADEMVALLEQLHAKKLVTPAACEAMLGHLRQCESDRLQKLLPASVKVAHKTGSVSAVRTDAGIIEAPSGPIAICILTRNNEDQRWTKDNAAEVLTGKIAKAVYDHFERSSVAQGSPPEILQLGANGPVVQALQRTLNERVEPSPDLSIDGDFGPATERAVRAFQQANKLEETGRVDAKTFAALGPLQFAEKPAPEPETINGEVLARESAEALNGPPHVTCKAWAIADGATGELLWGAHESDSLEIASTTKLMTAYLVLQLAKEKPEVLKEEIVFSEAADKTPGSTSDLRAGERVTVAELLYGLLLPSGNDAAVALAEHFGDRLAEKNSPKTDRHDPQAESSVDHFVAAMNRQAEALGMQETHFENPHGLSAHGHRSSARDLAKLAHAALQNAELRRYVSTRQRGAKVVGSGGYERNVVWKNTNHLLGIEGYEGLKTGTTTQAGACLVAKGTRAGDALLVVVLGSASPEARYVDSRNLFRFGWSERQKEKKTPAAASGR